MRAATGAPGLVTSAHGSAEGAAQAVEAALPDGWARAEVAALSSCGPVRASNEDRVGWTVVGSPASVRSPMGDTGPARVELRGPGIAVVVADGLGGHRHGALASTTAVRVLLRRLAELDATDRIPEALRAGFEEANEALLAGRLDASLAFEPLVAEHVLDGDVGPPPVVGGTGSAEGAPPSSLFGAQTTMTALAITGRRSHLAHVGDCRVFRLRDGRLELLTSDHTQVQELLRMRLIRPDQVARHPGRHLLTRSIGGDVLLRVDTRTREPAPGDVYLLCSDGLWSAVTGDDVLAAMQGDLATGAMDLVARSIERGGDDNASVILLRLLELGGRSEPSPPSGWRLPWRRGQGG